MHTLKNTQPSRSMSFFGGVCLIIGALLFVVVFSYLAINFDYPNILEGNASEVLPRLRSGGFTMRATWAFYAVLPLFIIAGAVGIQAALPANRGLMNLAVAFSVVGALAMCLGLMRWPSIHWVLSEAFDSGSFEARQNIAVIFSGLNSYLGNYVGEFLGEICLAFFFLISGIAFRNERRLPPWIGMCGIAFSALFVIGAFRNVSSKVQMVSEINNYLLPIWMIVLGVTVIWISRSTKFLQNS